MTLSRMTEEQVRQVVADAGYNPDDYDYREHEVEVALMEFNGVIYYWKASRKGAIFSYLKIENGRITYACQN